MTHEALQWIALGIALTSKENLAKVLAIDPKAFSWTDSGEARQLRNVLGQRTDVLRWFERFHVVPKEKESLMDAIVRVMREDVGKAKQMRLAGKLRKDAMLDAEAFKKAVLDVLEQLGDDQPVVGRIGGTG